MGRTNDMQRNRAGLGAGSDYGERTLWTDCIRCWRYLSCNSCCKTKRHRGHDRYRQTHNKRLDYSSGESDSDYENSYAYLTTTEKTKRILQLWKRCYAKLNAANILINKYNDLKERIRVSGSFNTDVKKRLEVEVIEENKKPPSWIIMPDDRHK